MKKQLRLELFADQGVWVKKKAGKGRLYPVMGVDMLHLRRFFREVVLILSNDHREHIPWADASVYDWNIMEKRPGTVLDALHLERALLYTFVNRTLPTHSFLRASLRYRVSDGLLLVVLETGDGIFFQKIAFGEQEGAVFVAWEIRDSSGQILEQYTDSGIRNATRNLLQAKLARIPDLPDRGA